MTMPRGGGGGATLEHIYTIFIVIIVILIIIAFLFIIIIIYAYHQDDDSSFDDGYCYDDDFFFCSIYTYQLRSTRKSPCSYQQATERVFSTSRAAGVQATAGNARRAVAQRVGWAAPPEGLFFT